jgi:F0F1-type ATP synthase assembly protein I
MPDEPRESRPVDEGEQTGQWARLAGVGTEFFAALLLPSLLGYWLDKVTGWRPWLMVAGGALGFAVGLMLLLRAAKQQFRD